MLSLTASIPLGLQVGLRPELRITRAAAPTAVVDEAFGASHTSFYTDAVKKDSYDMLDDVLAEKMADKELVEVFAARDSRRVMEST